MTKVEQPTSLTRRSVLLGSGALVVSIGAGVTLETVLSIGQAFAQGTKPPLTPDQLSSYIAVNADGRVMAGRGHVLMADIAALTDLPLPRWPRKDGSYPDGPGPEVREHGQLLQLIALGRTTAVLPESTRGHLPHGLAAVPVLDAPTVTTVIAWPPHSRSLALAGFVRAATRL